MGRIGITQERMMRKTKNAIIRSAWRTILWCLAIGWMAISQAAISGEVDREAAYAQAFAFMRTYYQQANLDKALERLCSA